MSTILASTVQAQTTSLIAPAARITDQAVFADQDGYAALQERIKAVNDTGVEVADYSLAKAQCWWDVSRHEYTRNDRSTFPQEALTEAEKIVAALETKSDERPADRTPLINGATRLRDDMWKAFDKLKHHSGFQCARKQVACGEVELVHAGNEYAQIGWRHANPYIQIAEDLLSSGQAAADRCSPAAAESSIKPTVAATPAVESIEKVFLSADALFKFSGATRADLLPQGRGRIDEMIENIGKAFSRIDSIVITGYTDRLGSDTLNFSLSEERAVTLKNYLQEKGIVGPISTFGKGKVEPVKECAKQSMKALIACLAPNRRVTLEIAGIKKNGLR